MRTRAQLFVMNLLCVAVFFVGVINCPRSFAQVQYKTVPPKIRTNSGEIVPPTEFPKPGSEERLWACLVSLDPINRRGILRLEKRDRMIEFTLLPSAVLFYRGAPAALGDFPPGTMVEAWGYGDESSQLPRNVLRLSDDFSICSFAEKAYRVDEIDLGKKTFFATLVSAPRATPSPYSLPNPELARTPSSEPDKKTLFHFSDQTDWYIGQRLADVNDLAIGQLIRMNFIRKFYEGPPLITRCTEVWLDQESQDFATKRQLRAFTSYTRDRAFPVRVDAVDDAKKVLTVTLLETGLYDIHREWKVGQTHDIAAAATSLRMFEPNGGQSNPDRMFGAVMTKLDDVPTGYGCGGAQMTFKVPYLFEAFRPGTIVKLYPSGTPVITLPIEERLPKEFDTFLR